MKATNIEWDIDMEEVFETLDNMTMGDIAKFFSLQIEAYAKMTTEEKHDLIADIFHHNPGMLYDFCELPEEEEIDVGISEEDVADYLANSYGYCIKSLNIVDETELGTFTVDVTLLSTGRYDVYIAHEGSSGEHYTDITADRIGEIVAEDIVSVAVNCQ